MGYVAIIVSKIKLNKQLQKKGNYTRIDYQEKDLGIEKLISISKGMTQKRTLITVKEKE